MKFLLAFVLLAPFSLFAQDCPLKKTRDPYTKEVRLSTGVLNAGGYKITVDAVSKEIDVFFMLGDGKCFDDQSSLVVNFDSTRVKANYKNTGTMNCEGYFHLTVRNTPVTNFNYQRLANKKISTLVFTSGKTVTTITLSEEEKVLLQKALICLAQEAKTLIPQ